MTALGNLPDPPMPVGVDPQSYSVALLEILEYFVIFREPVQVTEWFRPSRNSDFQIFRLRYSRQARCDVFGLDLSLDSGEGYIIWKTLNVPNQQNWPGNRQSDTCHDQSYIAHWHVSSPAHSGATSNLMLRAVTVGAQASTYPYTGSRFHTTAISLVLIHALDNRAGVTLKRSDVGDPVPGIGCCRRSADAFVAFEQAGHEKLSRHRG